MSQISLTVQSVTPSTNGGFIMKLQNKSTKTEETVFGTKTQESQLTYYMKVADTKCTVGYTATLDISQFAVVERPFIIQEAGKPDLTVDLKWLQLK